MQPNTKSCIYLKPFFKDFILFIFRERGRKGEREGEKHQCVVAPHTLPLQTWPPTQACALTGNGTSDPLVCRPALNPLSHTSRSLKPFSAHQFSLVFVYLMCGPRQLFFFQCGPETPKGWTSLQECSQAKIKSLPSYTACTKFLTLTRFEGQKECYHRWRRGNKKSGVKERLQR